jgi:molybdopterin-guanine dinucleotide biosynthesis protein A
VKGLILAGGSSSRMGRDKGTALLHGRPLLDYVLGALTSICDEVYISVGANRALYENWEKEGLARLISDEVADRGPVGALAAASKRIREGMVAVSSGDSPFVRPEFYVMLGEKAQRHDAAVPLIGGRHEPLHAVYSARALGEFANRLSAGMLRPIEAYEALDVKFVTEEECRLVDPGLMSLVNLNTPADLERWENTGGAAN